MYCSKCGTQLPDGTAFCDSCGQPTGGVPQTAVRPSIAVAGGSAAPAYAGPGSVSSYVPSAVPAVLPSPYAGFWLRFLAYLIDSVLAGIVFGIFVLLVVAIVGVGYFRAIFESLHSQDPTVPVALISLILLASAFSVLITWVYYAWMESSQYQGTLGKMALGLIVTDPEGRPITFARASGRFFAKIITGMIPLGIGYILAGFTEKKQALHDMIAGCLVLRKT